MEESKSPRRHSFLRRGLLRSKARGKSPSPEKVDRFLRERVNSFRDVPPEPSQYDVDEERFKTQSGIARDDLEKIINAHEREPGMVFKVSNSSWNTVFNQITAAKRRNEEMKHFSSEAADSVDVVLAYIDIIPDEYGLGILKDGLALVFEASKRNEEIRTKILDAFEALPDTIVTINTAYALLEPDPDDAKLHMQFLNMLIIDIPALVKILLGEEAWYRKIVSFLLLKIPESSTVDSILGRWTKELTRLKEHVEKQKIRLLAKFPAELNSINDQVKASEIGIRSMLAENSAMQQTIMDILRETTDLISKPLASLFRAQTTYSDIATTLREEIKSMRRDKELQKEELRREREQLAREREHNYNMIENAQAKQIQLEHDKTELSNRVETLTRQLRRQRLETHQGPRVKPTSIQPIQLLGILGVSMDDPWNDLDYVLRQAEQFDTDLRGQAQWLSNTAEFREWLQEDHSSILLAEGCTYPLLVSPISGFCCALISNLVDDDDSAVAFFFAGLHADKKRLGLNGPAAIMRSLISQLLLNSRWRKVNLEFVSKEMLDSCREKDCRVLCDVFVNIVKQAPPDMNVYCIVDGISWYEQTPWLADLYYVATMFEHLARRMNDDGLGTVKVLLTTSTRSIKIVDLATKRGSVWWHVSLASGDAHPEIGVTS
ncbi:hypothetical protein F5Y13DRAFT_173566 [Hypoxylon sp. FL1857]|nr:hypothetical protein F5Y13DRAFT_173566 [Hypoxylon sp. FL1857]